jgi:hypothetical protein
MVVDEMVMKVYQVAGYPSGYYFVKDWQEFSVIMSWMIQNDVRFLHETSSSHGYGFSIKSNIEWFLLKWA